MALETYHQWHSEVLKQLTELAYELPCKKPLSLFFDQGGKYILPKSHSSKAAADAVKECKNGITDIDGFAQHCDTLCVNSFQSKLAGEFESLLGHVDLRFRWVRHAAVQFLFAAFQETLCDWVTRYIMRAGGIATVHEPYLAAAGLARSAPGTDPYAAIQLAAITKKCWSHPIARRLWKDHLNRPKCDPKTGWSAEQAEKMRLILIHECQMKFNSPKFGNIKTVLEWFDLKIGGFVQWTNAMQNFAEVVCCVRGDVVHGAHPVSLQVEDLRRMRIAMEKLLSFVYELDDVQDLTERMRVWDDRA